MPFDNSVPLPGLDPLEVDRSLVACRLCGRPLRDRDARLWGLGAGCRHKLRVRSAPRPPQGDVEQDILPGTGED